MAHQSIFRNFGDLVTSRPSLSSMAAWVAGLTKPHAINGMSPQFIASDLRKETMFRAEDNGGVSQTNVKYLLAERSNDENYHLYEVERASRPGAAATKKKDWGICSPEKTLSEMVAYNALVAEQSGQGRGHQFRADHQIFKAVLANSDQWNVFFRREESALKHVVPATIGKASKIIGVPLPTAKVTIGGAVSLMAPA